MKRTLNPKYAKLKVMADFGVELVALKASFLYKCYYFIRKRVFRRLGILPVVPVEVVIFERKLKALKPKLVIVNQAINFDGVLYAHICMKLGVPYVLIVQKAVDFYWPDAAVRPLVKQVYQQAVHSYFVSERNKTLTEQQLATSLERATVINNPVKTIGTLVAYPDERKKLKLACLGRFLIIDKGQDMLLRILSKPVWKAREVHLAIYGSGEDEAALKELCIYLKCSNVEFHSWTEDVGKIWETHHALVLPSRSEGMALTLLEAMAAGRTCIVTRAGGHEELISHGVNGFISEVSELDFELVLEEAYQRRSEWRAIGQRAQQTIRHRYENAPVDTFEKEILAYLHGKE